ncbi:helix-turn-helix domain-containing protein [Dyadobacter psychrotolerans]|uniref:XRE family transcriptional regulator n=1 Tax=Dyadobacter psychrotolerans TaxID=2541721 RepID=A0A4R5D809_9BACT|nr:helix-turn-helix transcriptional regulator [Dyadobacter psychrotolerans]TDE09566.1 XRE family transcriptional regulator [Dyadobacter psychrotolerans]
MESKVENQLKFASAVLQAAKEKNLSLRKLSAASGLEYSQVQRICKGKVNLALSTIVALSEGLEISLSKLFSYYETLN